MPWYVHPALDPPGWRRLARVVGPAGFAVVNVHNGPGQPGDPYYGPALASLPDRGPRLLGYVDLDYGRRPLAPILADVARWRQWYGVAAVMLDQVPAAAGEWVAGVVGRVREAGAGTVVGNPGVVAAPEVLAAFDVVCVVEDTAERYLRTTAPLARTGREHRTWHLVHSCPPRLRGAVGRRADALGAAYLHVTAAQMPHPWCGQAGWWPRATSTRHDGA